MEKCQQSQTVQAMGDFKLTFGLACHSFLEAFFFLRILLLIIMDFFYGFFFLIHNVGCFYSQIPLVGPLQTSFDDLARLLYFPF